MRGWPRRRHRDVGILPPLLYSFPGHPAWSAKRRAVELRWCYDDATASAWIYAPAIEAIVGRGASPADMVRAVFLYRAQIEHAIEAKVRRRRPATGDVSLSEREVRAAVERA